MMKLDKETIHMGTGLQYLLQYLLEDLNSTQASWQAHKHSGTTIPTRLVKLKNSSLGLHQLCLHSYCSHVDLITVDYLNIQINPRNKFIARLTAAWVSQ